MHGTLIRQTFNVYKRYLYANTFYFIASRKISWENYTSINIYLLFISAPKSRVSKFATITISQLQYANFENICLRHLVMPKNCRVKSSAELQLFANTAGPESLEDYFQKGDFLGQKATLNQMLGNSFCEYGLVSKYQRFSAAF